MRALSVQKKVLDSTLCIKHNFQLKLGHTKSQGTVLQLTTDH